MKLMVIADFPLGKIRREGKNFQIDLTPIPFTRIAELQDMSHLWALLLHPML